jgi:C-terminal binding protein
VRRSSVQTFGIVGLGRIGTAAALRAKAFGYRVAWCNRTGAPEEELGVRPDHVITSLTEVAALV